MANDTILACRRIIFLHGQAYAYWISDKTQILHTNPCLAEKTPVPCTLRITGFDFSLDKW